MSHKSFLLRYLVMFLKCMRPLYFISSAAQMLQSTANLTWMLAYLRYTPVPQYYGEDYFELLVEENAMAEQNVREVQRLGIQVAVLANPCLNNGQCRGENNEDTNCVKPARMRGFHELHYVCVCSANWTGVLCELPASNESDVADATCNECALQLLAHRAMFIWFMVTGGAISVLVLGAVICCCFQSKFGPLIVASP